MHAYKIVKEIKYQYVQFFLIKGELVRVLWKSWSWDVMLIHLNTSAQQMPCRKNLPKILHNFTTSRFKWIWHDIWLWHCLLLKEIGRNLLLHICIPHYASWTLFLPLMNHLHIHENFNFSKWSCLHFIMSCMLL